MNKIKILVGMSVAIFMLSQCKEGGPGDITSDPEAVLNETPYELAIGTFPEPEFNGNELTVEGVRLGKMLFYEKMMSQDNSISCGSCHKQENGFSDPDRLSEGVGGSLGKRQAMAIFNTAWHTNEFFWDGRSHLLRDQSLKPIQDELEMKETLEGVITKLQEEQIYLDQFTRAFGDESITSERMSLALEQFMNSIVSNQSKYDAFLAGSASLTDSEERGRVLFFAEYNPSFPEVSGAEVRLHPERAAPHGVAEHRVRRRPDGVRGVPGPAGEARLRGRRQAALQGGERGQRGGRSPCRARGAGRHRPHGQRLGQGRHDRCGRGGHLPDASPRPGHRHAARPGRRQAEGLGAKREGACEGGGQRFHGGGAAVQACPRHRPGG